MTRRRSQTGMTLIEVMLAMAVIVISVGGLGLMILSTQRSSQEMARRDMVRAQAVKYMERLLRLPYGTDFDPAATAGQLEEMFDDNAVVTGGSTLSLMSLRTPVNDEGWRFFIQGFEAEGVFEIEVNSDLDGNGTFEGIRGTETPSIPDGVAGDGTTVVTLISENTPLLMRVEIFWNGESVFRTLRAAPVEGT